VDADAVEIRVLGCLIEKQKTTPDTYPLSLNALRVACNQATNRDPVVTYDESMIRAALDRLGRKGWVRLASGRGSRAVKHRHLLDLELRLSDAEIALLCVLMLRGPQTPGELKQRTERLHGFATLDELEEVLAGLAERELAERLPRRPGQKEQRHRQLLGGDERAEEEPQPEVPADLPRVFSADEDGDGESDDDRLAAVERELSELRDQVVSLRAELASLRERP
jgi:uncharacterized protein YceH (UPF0502 family)